MPLRLFRPLVSLAVFGALAADALGACAAPPTESLPAIDAAGGPSDARTDAGETGADADDRCGDGLLEPPEQCDDRNRAPGDGCTPWCQVEADCGGRVAQPIVPGAVVLGDTTGLPGVASSAQCGGGAAGEQIYQLTLYEPAHLSVTTDLGPTRFDTAIYLRSRCGTQASELACAGPGGALGDTFEIDLAPGTVFLFVDGRGGQTGPFALAVTAAPRAR